MHRLQGDRLSSGGVAHHERCSLQKTLAKQCRLGQRGLHPALAGNPAPLPIEATDKTEHTRPFKAPTWDWLATSLRPLPSP